MCKLGGIKAEACRFGYFLCFLKKRKSGDNGHSVRVRLIT
nr:MAG TPA: hypothetical protein [Caudoviricetes sp.]